MLVDAIKQDVINKLKKIKKLANKGYAGEATAAQALLKKVADRYGIDLASLGSDVKKFTVRGIGWRISLLFQLCANVCGVDNFNVLRGSTKNEYVVECEEDKWLEIAAKFKILEKDYKDQIGLFYEAFIVCNGLALSSNQQQLDDDHVKEDIEKLKKIAKMAKGLTRSAKPQNCQDLKLLK